MCFEKNVQSKNLRFPLEGYKIRSVKFPLLKSRREKFFFEIRRKIWHFFAGFAFLAAHYAIFTYVSEELSLMFLVVSLLVMMEFDHIRLEYRPRVMKAIHILLRKREYNSTSSYINFLVSSIIAFAVFDYWIALAAMLMVVVGDSFSALFGLAFGKKKLRRNKTYVGTFAGLIANLAVGAAVLHQYPLVFIPMALTASVIELLTNKMDDNLTVPVSTVFAGYLMTLLFHINITL